MRRKYPTFRNKRRAARFKRTRDTVRLWNEAFFRYLIDRERVLKWYNDIYPGMIAEQAQGFPEACEDLIISIANADLRWKQFGSLVDYKRVNKDNHSKYLFLSMLIEPRIGPKIEEVSDAGNNPDLA